ncbi:MAG: protein kinase [Planctomycetes bacterium]|nr:protein kinase [Planctomycetota bacterium]
METDDLLAQVTEVAGYKVLPPCVIYARIGQGGMGAVYRGHHLNLDIDVAVKCLKPQLVKDDPQFVARFRREGQSAAKINHQNVIRVYDVAEDQGLHYLIMELVQGETARQRVERKGPLAIGEALQLIYESALGLGEAHRLGIVHRDIKPDNLLVSGSGQVKVADLGLAKPTIAGRNQSMLSQPNQIMGTPSYMPPEQWEGAAVTAAADVWALGATLWFLLVGREAIVDDSPARIMSRIVLQPFPDVRELRRDVPADVAAVLAKATAKEPAQRYLDAAEMAEAIGLLPTRRASLRDGAAGSTELRTLLSPPPVQNLEEIKQWLRDDLRTRPQTPSTRSGPPRSEVLTVASGKGGEPPRGGTLVQAPPNARRSPIVATAVVLLLGAGGGAWALFGRTPPVEPEPQPKPIGVLANSDGKLPNRVVEPEPKPPVVEPKPVEPPRPEPQPVPKPEPPPEPFAAADRFEQEGKLEQAIQATTEALAENGKQERLARLRSKRAQQLFDARDYGRAINELKLARAQGDSPALQQQRTTMLAAMLDTAQKQLVRSKPDAPVQQPGQIEFSGVLDLPWAELLLGDRPAVLGAGGAFRELRTVGADGRLPVAVRIDGERFELAPWQVAFVTTPLPPLAFVDEPQLATPRADGRLITMAPSIELLLTVNDPAAKVTVDGAAVTELDGGRRRIVAALPENVWRELVVAARRGDQEVTNTVRVLRLTRKPAIVQPISPDKRQGFKSRSVVLPLRVRAEEFTIAATAIQVVDGKKKQTPLQRDPEDQSLFSADLTLASGNNTIEVRLENLVGQFNSENFVVTCQVQVPELSTPKLDDNGRLRPVVGDTPLFIANAAAKLRLQSNDKEAALLLDGEECKTNEPFVVDLQPFLVEGEPRTLVLQTRNELGTSKELRVTVGLDTTLPQVVVGTPNAPVAPDQPFECMGTWTDFGGMQRIRVGDVDARLSTGEDGKSGMWTVRLPAPLADKSIDIVATDRAGNVAKLPFQLKVRTPATENQPPAPAPTPTPTEVVEDPPAGRRPFPGFSTKPGSPLNEIGYPQLLVHDATGIELVALGFEPRRRPQLYVAVRETTQRQWDPAAAGDQPQANVDSSDISGWLRLRGRLLELPTASDWELMLRSREPKLSRLDSGLVEWLAPDAPGNSWPTRKDPNASAANRLEKSPQRGFRTVLRPK